MDGYVTKPINRQILKDTIVSHTASGEA